MCTFVWIAVLQLGEGMHRLQVVWSFMDPSIRFGNESNAFLPIPERLKNGIEFNKNWENNSEILAFLPLYVTKR